jgi:hypothetical protein
MLDEMTNFFGVILVPLRPPTARSHAPKSFGLPLAPLKTSSFSLRFFAPLTTQSGRKRAFSGQNMGLGAFSGRSCGWIVDGLWTGCGFSG